MKNRLCPLLFFVWTMAACASTGVVFDPSKPHHGDGEFVSKKEGSFLSHWFMRQREPDPEPRDPDDIARFAGTLGLDEAVFRDTMFSFAGETRLRRAMQLAQAYEVTGVPTLAINGKYKTSASKAGGHAQMINVLDALLRAELGT